MNSLLLKFYSFTTLFASIASFVIGFTLLILSGKSRSKKSLHYIWFILCLAIGGWNFGYYITMIPGISKDSALLASRLSHASGILIIPFFLQFSAILRPTYFKNRFLTLPLCYFTCISFAILSLTPFVVIDLVPKLFMKYYPVGSIGYALYIIFFASWITYAHIMLIKALKESTGVARNQIKYFLLGTIPGFAGGATCFPLIFGIPFSPLASTLIAIYPFTTAYAILRHRLMDIKLAVTRAGIFIVVYAFVLGLPFLIGYFYGLWKYSTVLMLVLATLGPIIFARLEKSSKELLYKTEFKRYETLRRFSKTLLLIKELDKLVELIVYRLVKTLKVNYAGIYLYDKENDVYSLKSYRSAYHSDIPENAGRKLTKNDMLMQLVFAWKKELIREELANLPLSKKSGENSKIDLGLAQFEMQQMGASLIIPHFLDNELLGFLVLGHKEKDLIYTEEDISILSALSNSAALAIENAMFLIDLKITQAQLFDAKRIAELGYMASAMGHEINNRLQAIYSVSLDLVDNPAIFDVVKNNPQAKEAFEKDIKHINENVEDATRIINELKAYARPQDNIKQDFKPISLNDIIDKAINVVKLQSAKSFNMVKLDINIPAGLPKTLGNFIQLQQVFVNMLNNAYDAIIEKRNRFVQHPASNPENFTPEIRIRAEEIKNNINIHIIDNGVGMTEEIKKRLFIPLYTSKATADRKAERDIKGGTGIGLYTIQTIMKGHGGAISVHNTKWLEGTDFLITLPVAR